MPPACVHEHPHLDVSPYAAKTRFQRVPLQRRRGATTPSGRAPGPDNGLKGVIGSESLFPGPLVLPDDALAIDPKEPPQSLRSWIHETARNPITPRRKTIYVAPPPQIATELHGVVDKWAVPSKKKSPACPAPEAEDVRQYLEAFYHPLPVKLLTDDVRFVPWTDGTSNSKGTAANQYIGLQIGTSITRITARPCPDGAFGRQLDLNHILDAAIAALPADAYALVLLTNHDLYEDEDDDFCCGRAYGGSRVCVVSASRYHPALDAAAGIERAHAWPFAHCEAFVQRLCAGAEVEAKAEAPGKKTKQKKRKRAASNPPPEADAQEEGQDRQPMAEVIKAALTAPAPGRELGALWFSRVARTVAHEVGHCFCLAHCPYYACVMQGTASVVEDMRQPPYLCLVCLAKVTSAVLDVERGTFNEARFLIKKRYEVLVEYCKKWEHTAMFAGYRCWLEKRLEEMEAMFLEATRTAL